MQQEQVQGLVLDTASLEQSRGPRWYLEDQHSTAEASNASLGIENIVLTPATTQAQLNAGAIGQVALHTTIGSFYMTAFRGKKDPGSVRLALPTRQYVDKDGVTQNQEQYSLRSAVRAQILKFVHSKCKEAEVAKQAPVAQAQANPALQALAGVDPAVLMQLVTALGLGGAGAQAQAQAQPQAQAQADVSSVPPIITEGAF